MNDPINPNLSSQAKDWINENRDKINDLIGTLNETECSDRNESSKVYYLDNFRPPSISLENKTQSLIAKTILYVVVVAFSTGVLVASSIEVFGLTWQGIAKAILLEVGILALVSMTFSIRWSWTWFCIKDLIAWVFARGTLIFLLYLSVVVLHTGVESKKQTDIAQFSSQDESLKTLRMERDSYQKIHDSLGSQYITKKTELLNKISGLNADIRNRVDLIPSSQSSIMLQSNTEMLMRIVLLLINMIFGHRLWKSLSKLEWPTFRGSVGNLANKFS